MKHPDEKPAIQGTSITYDVVLNGKGKVLSVLPKKDTNDIIIIEYYQKQIRKNLVAIPKKKYRKKDSFTIWCNIYFGDYKSLNTPKMLREEKYDSAYVNESPEHKANFFFPPKMMIIERPEFIGDYVKFIQKNIKYPKTAARDGISGRVIIEYVLEKDGTISNIKTVQGVREDLDAEATRIVQLMSGMWTPGKNNGKTRTV